MHVWSRKAARWFLTAIRVLISFVVAFVMISSYSIACMVDDILKEQINTAKDLLLSAHRQYVASLAPGKPPAGVCLDFNGADLQYAIFDNANLDNARFINAKCHRAEFAGADFYSADFAGANLSVVKFKDAKLPARLRSSPSTSR